MLCIYKYIYIFIYISVATNSDSHPSNMRSVVRGKKDNLQPYQFQHDCLHVISAEKHIL